MELQINSKNMTLSDKERQQIERKLDKFGRYLPNITDARIEIIHEKTRSPEEQFAAHLTLNTNGAKLYGEERGGDMLTTVDRVAETMHRRIEHYKGKLYDRRQGKKDRASIKNGADTEIPPRGQVVKNKRFSIRAITVEDAISDMEYLGHNFFLFLNADTDNISVVYRRYDDNYGLIEADLE